MTEASSPGGAQGALLRRALLGLEQAEARIGELERAARAPIAVIGLGCRVPGAEDPAAFWRLLAEGRDAVGPVPPDRWDAAAYQTDDPETPGRIAARAAGFLHAPVDRFDPGFFGIAPREAQGMDPQQRLLLEVSFEALEHAGQAPDRLERSATGVYIGLCASDYANLALKTHDLGLLDAHFTSGIAHSIASGRLSYLLGLQGPSITLDTACSSSLVAVHLACQALRSGDCRMALAGGVNLLLAPELYIALSRARMLARDGRCKTFDATADGFGRGEGCGVLVLKRLSDAESDGDRILAVIRGSAVNQDGPSGSLTAPNGPAQEAVIREALTRAGVGPNAVSYIEAHGTGTELGDPLEVQALGNVFGEGRAPDQPLWLGSVKTNIGHLEGAAGVVGLIKLVLSLVHGQIPAHLHFRTPSPHIPWSELPLRVPTALTAWEPIEGRRLGGVSSFGFSGTNAHVIVEQAPERPAAPPTPSNVPRLLALSARDEPALAALAARYVESLRARPELTLEDVCFTANTGRSHFACRATILAHSREELVTRLAALAALEPSDGVARVRAVPRDPPRVAFLFTGQGAQYPGMARSLYDAAPVFRAAVDRVAELLAPQLDRPLRELIFPDPGAATPLDQTGYCQPALFAVEYALAELLRAWGVVPDMVIGHSVGEYAAACVAGMLDLPSAVGLVAERGRLMQSLPAGGGMAAVFASEERAARALRGHEARVSIAAVNGPEQTVIAGPSAELESICAVLRDEGIRCQPLPVSHAFHSPLVEPMLAAFGSAATKVRFQAPRLPFVSNVTGGVLTASRATDPQYFRDHVRAPVRFGAGLQALLALKPGVAIELGPHPTLLSFARATFGETGPLLLSTLHKQRPDTEQMLALASALYLAGMRLDFRALTGDGAGRIVDLPTYPFQRERYWFQAETRVPRAAPGTGTHPLLGRALRTGGRETIFEVELGADSPGFVRQHTVQGQVVLPATAYLDGLLALARQKLDPARATVTDVSLEEAMLFAADGATRSVQYICEHERDGSIAVAIKSAPSDDESASFERHVAATLCERSIGTTALTLGEVRARCTRPRSAAEHYLGFVARGLDFGEDFRVVRELWCGTLESLGLVELSPASAREAVSYCMHPLLLDGCLQVLAAALAEEPGDALFLPIAVGAYRLLASPGTRCLSHARVEPGTGEIRRAQLTIYAESGAVLAELSGVELKRVRAGALARNAERWLDDILYEFAWREAGLESAPLFGPEFELAATARAASRAVPELRRSAEIDAYDAFLPRFERLCDRYVLAALQKLGWSPAPGESVSAGDLAARLRVLPRHGKLFGRLLAMLAEAGFLERGPGAFRVARALTAGDPERELSELSREFPCGAIELDVTAATAREMAGALRGDVDPMQLLFPGGSTARAERLYRDTPTARFYNGLLTEVVAALSERASTARPLRILEIGGGTGGSTAHVLPRLPREGVEYTFTDVGSLFVARARERFAAHPGMRFSVFDLEREPEAQGLAAGAFDCVIASNVVHATSRLGVTLERVRRLLAPGGVLAMLEVTAPQRWFDLTVGFTEGWWAFTDTELRTDYATLARERWFDVLAGAGFEQVQALPESAAATATLSLQSLFLARRAGAPVSAREWLLFADAGGVARALARQLSERGDRCVLVTRGAFAFEGDEAQIDATSAANYRRLLAALRDAGRAPHAVIYGWALDANRPENAGAESAPDTTSALLLSQALIAASAPRLVLLTSGARQVSADERDLDAEQAALWGFARTLRREHPELGCTCIDLAPGETPPVAAIAAELDEPSRESEISWRGETRRVERLVHRSPSRRRGLGAAAASSRSEPYRLLPATPGSLAAFVLVPAERRVPGPGELEIRVEATGLNFKDVLNVLGMYPGQAGPLGGECSGTVLSVGEGVRHVAPGDAVMAVAAGSFTSHVIARSELVQRRPPALSAEEAATFPIAFLTAAFCLEHLAQIRASDRVLIHAAAGGVGMAALRIARRAGAEVFATAGSPWKRELVKSLGAAHVFDSRNPDFAREIAAITHGRGVDVVLNSLAGPQLEASFAALAQGGRFVEIGKRGIKDSAWVAALARDIAYHVVDWGETAEREPALIGDLFERLARDLESGRLTSLPRHAFALEHAAQAFRLMAAAGHAGKVVVRHGPATRGVRADGTYLVTGGLSGLGLVVARWLVEHGAGRVVLMGRRAVDARVEAELAPLRRPGTTLVAESVNVTDERALRGLIARLRRDDPPLRGVLHGAGVLEDASLLQQTPARFEHVFAPKIRGTELLDALTRADPLDWFVLFSSAAAVLGSAGQANHAAANAFLGTFARERQAKGLHGLCIDWGAWTEVGAAVERGVTERLAALGLGAVTPAQGLSVLERLLAEDSAEVAVLPADWRRYAEQANGGVPALLSELVKDEAPVGPAATRAEVARPADLRAELAALPEGRRRPRLAAFVRERALKALGLPASFELEPTTPLGELGLDSLLAVELRNNLATALARPMPPTLLFDYPTLQTLTDYLFEQALELAPKAEPEAVNPQTSLLESIEDLSDEEVERQLAALKNKQ